MASFLEEKEEIKKEEKRKFPTITIAISCHGEDLIDEKLAIDSNVRIYSRAGMPLCVNVGNSIIDIPIINNLYFSNERMSGEDTRSSYEMLQELSKQYKIPKYDETFLKIITKVIKEYPKPVKHTIKTIAKQKHSQIYTPYYDHQYFFTDKSLINSNFIAVLETKNHTSKSNINYQNLLDLARNRYNIQYFSSLKVRNELEEKRILEFFKKFNLTPMPQSQFNENNKPVYHLIHQNLMQYSKDIYKNRHLIFVDGFVSEEKLLLELENPHSKIYEYITYPEDKEIIEKTINEIKNLESDDDELRSQKIKKRSKFYVDDDNKIIESIYLSNIIDFLKSEGFVIINIIDFSCRSVKQEVSKDRIRILNEMEEMMRREIDEGLGRKRRQKTKRLRQIKKRTQRRKRGKRKKENI